MKHIIEFLIYGLGWMATSTIYILWVYMPGKDETPMDRMVAGGTYGLLWPLLIWPFVAIAISNAVLNGRAQREALAYQEMQERRANLILLKQSMGYGPLQLEEYDITTSPEQLKG